MALDSDDEEETPQMHTSPQVRNTPSVTISPANAQQQDNVLVNQIGKKYGLRPSCIKKQFKKRLLEAENQEFHRKPSFTADKFTGVAIDNLTWYDQQFLLPCHMWDMTEEPLLGVLEQSKEDTNAMRLTLIAMHDIPLPKNAKDTHPKTRECIIQDNETAKRFLSQIQVSFEDVPRYSSNWQTMAILHTLKMDIGNSCTTFTPTIFNYNCNIGLRIVHMYDFFGYMELFDKIIIAKECLLSLSEVKEHIRNKWPQKKSEFSKVNKNKRIFLGHGGVQIPPTFYRPHAVYDLLDVMFHINDEELDILRNGIAEYLEVAPAAPPVEPPAAPPVEPPAAPPVEPPAAPPVEPSVEPPAAPSVEPPAAPPVEPSVEPPAAPSVEPPAAPSVEPPAAPSVEPPAAPPVEPPAAPSVEPPAAPPMPPTEQSTALPPPPAQQPVTPFVQPPVTTVVDRIDTGSIGRMDDFGSGTMMQVFNTQPNVSHSTDASSDTIVNQSASRKHMEDILHQPFAKRVCIRLLEASGIARTPVPLVNPKYDRNTTDCMLHEWHAQLDGTSLNADNKLTVDDFMCVVDARTFYSIQDQDVSNRQLKKLDLENEEQRTTIRQQDAAIHKLQDEIDRFERHLQETKKKYANLFDSAGSFGEYLVTGETCKNV